MGVWIETTKKAQILRWKSVTPCMGVWIETDKRKASPDWAAVTPCMGVWIETLMWVNLFKIFKSHPVWVCGLKLSVDFATGQEEAVTPCMGVWIETWNSVTLQNFLDVTPCMGVWIETTER